MRRSLVLLLLTCGAARPESGGSPDSVISYPLPFGDSASGVYSVTVNGTKVPVSNSRDASYAHFAFTGTAQVDVSLTEAVASYKLSPAAAGIVPVVKGSTLRFTLTRPLKLILHHVNRLSEKLCILADPPEEGAPRPGDPGVLLLSGVDATGATDESARLQAALDGLPAGGTLSVPAGRYGFTNLQMRSGKNLYLAPGAVLQASGAGVPPYNNAQLSFTGVRDVTLFGRGVLDGHGYALRKSVNGKEVGRALISAAPGSSSENVVLRDVFVRNPPVYSCIVFDTVGWRFSNVKFITDADYANRDGIAPHNAQRLVVDDCLFLTSDDCVVYSTTRAGIDMAGIVKNCVMFNSVSGTALRHGPWIGDKTRNFTAENIDIVQGCEKAGNDAAIAFYAGGSLSDVRYRNIRVEDPHWRLITMETSWTDHYAGVRRGSISKVVFERLSCDAAGLIHLKGGTPSEPIDQIAFRDFTHRGRAVNAAGDCEYAASGTVRDVRFSPGSSPVVSISSVSQAADCNTPTEWIVTRSIVSASPLEIGLGVRGTAKAGRHYTRLPATVIIPSRQSSTRIPLQPLAATLPDGVATVLVELDHSASRAYLLGPAYRAQVTLMEPAGK